MCPTSVDRGFLDGCVLSDFDGLSSIKMVLRICQLTQCDPRLTVLIFGCKDSVLQIKGNESTNARRVEEYSCNLKQCGFKEAESQTVKRGNLEVLKNWPQTQFKLY